MVVEGVDLHLEIGVVVEQGRVRVPGTFQLLAHVHDLVFLRPDAHFQVLDLRGQLAVKIAVFVNPALEVSVFLSVAFLHALQVGQLTLEVRLLVFQLDHFRLSFDELALLSLEVVAFLVNESVQIFNAVERFGNVVLKCSDLPSQVIVVVGHVLIVLVQSFDLLGIFLVSLPDGR